MWLSVFLIILFVFLGKWLSGRWLSLARVACFYVIWMTMLTEYSIKAEDLNCRVAGAFNYAEQEKECVGRTDYVLRTNQAIFNPLERYALHTLNYSMALIGYAVGYKEVAIETALLSWLQSKVDYTASNKARRNQCTLTDAEYAHTVSFKGSDDFFLSASYIRKAIDSTEENSVKTIRGITAQEARGANNNDVYSYFLAKENLRVPLALYVNFDKTTIARSNDSIHVVWEGPMLYPSRAGFNFSPIAFGIPPLHKFLPVPDTIPLYESLFCGMQMDGAMTPYIQVWEADITPDDERLSKEHLNSSDRTWFSSLAAVFLNFMS
ncbi:hypothetical protein [Vibrio inusitatus]